KSIAAIESRDPSGSMASHDGLDGGAARAGIEPDAATYSFLCTEFCFGVVKGLLTIDRFSPIG
ncbi:MAG: hypothetical protein ACE5HV_18390, partial [Acidobacteriota bacterium]